MSEKNPPSVKIAGAAASFDTQGKHVRPCAPQFSTGEFAPMPSMDHAAVRQDEALDWLLQLQQSPNDAAVQAAFERWRAIDDANAKAFRKAERVWQLTGQLQPELLSQPFAINTAPPSPPPTMRLNPRHRRRRIHWVGAALAACLVIAIAPQLSPRWQADYRTGPDEIRDVTLSDGSVVQLDSDSAIAVDFDAQHRGVKLLKGQAFFKVTSNKRQPFQVRAQAMQVTVTGTAFNVAIAPSQVSVAVEHGSVQVEDWKAGRALAALRPGQRLDYIDGKANERSFVAAQAAIWRQGQLIADDIPISEVVEQLRRYVPGLVLLRDPTLGSQRVTGVYDIRHPKTALRAVIQPYGGQIDHYGPWLMVVRASP